MALRAVKLFESNNVVMRHIMCVEYSDFKSSRIMDLITSTPLGSQRSIQGWVKAVRKMKDYLFVDVNDGSCANKIQVVIPKSNQPINLGFGASVRASGQLDFNPNGQLELKATDVTVVGVCDVTDGYPFAARSSRPPDYIRKYLHLRSQTNTFCSLLRARDAATRAIHNHFHSNGFIGIHTPILTSNDCEGAGEVFTVRPENEYFIKSMNKPGLNQDEAYFDTKTYLTVSGQLHLEAVARGLSSVYTFGPTFRAENSRSRLHLAEFYMVEAEVAFMETIEDLLALIESLIKGVTNVMLNESENDLHMLQDSSSIDFLRNVIDKPFGVMTYDEAFDIVDKHSQSFSSKARKEEGFGKEHELFLVKYNENQPIFIVDWPKDMKPFYMKQSSDPSKVSAVDLLAPHVGELCGGSLREDDYSLLQQKLLQLGLDKSLAWYLELRKYGSVPSGGFGMGFERYLQLLLGIGNIKDTIPFPRWPHNCKL